MTEEARFLRRWAGFALALGLALLSVWQLERARAGLEIERFDIGSTPATLYRLPGGDGPLVVIAHGFAGSTQLMEAYALNLARAGYTALAFDFEGHGRNPVPMSGDVTAVEGTTQLLIDETLKVMNAGLAIPGVAPPAALLGHSMATDVIVRAAAQSDAVGPVVAISMFSEAVTPDAPPDLLMITGQWEGALRDFAREALAMVDPDAAEGETAVAGDVRRRAVVAPHVEHVGVLYSTTGIAEAIAWLDAAYGRSSGIQPFSTGPWIALLLASIVAMARPLATLLPDKKITREPLPWRRFAAVIAVPALAAPAIAVWIEIAALPVLVADYLMVHLLVYGAVQLALLARFGVPMGRFSVIAAAALAAWGIGVFGLALDRYAVNFTPHAGRLAVIALLALGCVPFMAADALVTRAGRETLPRRLLARGAFLVSLGIAVALDFERLFFLVIIAPIIVLFFLIFGLMGRWVGRQSGALSAGVALGLVLAWALGVSFPLFSSGPAG